MAIALLGLAVINPFGEGLYSIGTILAFAQAFVYSIFIVYTRYEEKKHRLGSVFWIFLFATLYLTPFVLKSGFGDYRSVIHYILILGILSTGLAYLLLIYGLRKTKAENAAILVLISHTVSSILFAILFIKETITLNMFVGGVLLISSGVYLVYSKKIKHLIHHH